MKQEQQREIELRLFESKSGYELLDMIAQANLKLDEISLDELDSMAVQFSSEVSSARWQNPTPQSA